MGVYLKSFIGGKHFNDLEVVGFIDDSLPTCSNHSNTGIKLIGTLDEVSKREKWNATEINLLLAIGYNDLQARFQAYKKAKNMGYIFENLIHPSATICSEVHIEEACFVGPGAIIDSGNRLCAANFIDAGCKLGEFSILGCGNYLAIGSTVCGRVKMGNCNFIGAAAMIRDGIKIGNNNTVNMGVPLIEDIGNNIKVMEMRKRYFLK